MDDTLLKPLVEATYLTTENAWRYRAILRYFYVQHERLRHFLFPEEVYEFLKQSTYFQDYTEDMLQQDLNKLVEWKNLIPRQETGKVSSIEEFKKKRFRYQCTPYTVEIERMVQGLEQMGDSFGGSLERTLFDRLLESLLRLTSARPSSHVGERERNGIRDYEVVHIPNEELNQLWEDTFANFRRLTENSTDYLAHLKSEKVEELMLTDAFLVFKDTLTEYLRNFMTGLQRTSYKIEAVLKETQEEFLIHVTERLADYQASIPRLEGQLEQEEFAEKYREQWYSLKRWFLGRDGRDSELLFLQNETNETIRRITRFAQRLGERHNNFRSRRKDYLHLAEWFGRLGDDIKEAHRLSACVFGVFHTRHLFADPKLTEDIYAEIWDESPTVITLKPRIRQYREKTKPGAVTTRDADKKRVLEEYLREKESERRLIDELIRNQRILVSDLPMVDPYVRKTLLGWIGKCMSSSDRCAKTETGQRLQLRVVDDSRVTLVSEDGELTMPNYEFTFLD